MVCHSDSFCLHLYWTMDLLSPSLSFSCNIDIFLSIHYCFNRSCCLFSLFLSVCRWAIEENWKKAVYWCNSIDIYMDIYLIYVVFVCFRILTVRNPIVFSLIPSCPFLCRESHRHLLWSRLFCHLFNDFLIWFFILIFSLSLEYSFIYAISLPTIHE